MTKTRRHITVVLALIFALVGEVAWGQTDIKTTQVLRGKVSLNQPTSSAGTPLPKGGLSPSPNKKRAYDPVPQGGFMCRCLIENGDTIPYFELPTLYVFRPLVFKNKRQEKFYWRTVRDVKRVLPISYAIKDLIAQTNDTLMTMHTKRERDKYMKSFEKRVYNSNKAEMSKLTLNQGMLLIRMIDRTCNATSYELIRAYLGSFKANFYQMFAKMLGGNLKASFGSREEDAMVERIILMVESGQL